jgi:hypothetical protein
VQPWQTEPDRLDFEAEYPCAMRRHPLYGNWCAYVGVDQAHPLFGLPTNHPLKLPSSWFEHRRGLEGTSPVDIFLHAMHGGQLTEACPINLAFQVHGGVNYARDHVPGEAPDGLWRFGFDCGHADDYAPALLDMLDTVPPKMRRLIGKLEGQVYRDQQYVVSECQALAQQLAAVVPLITKLEQT